RSGPLMARGLVTGLAWAGVSFGSCSTDCGDGLMSSVVALVQPSGVCQRTSCGPRPWGTVSGARGSTAFTDPTGSTVSCCPGLPAIGKTCETDGRLVAQRA